MGLFRRNKDVRDLKAMAEHRRIDEDGEPWFVGDDDEPELRIETGVSFDSDDFEGG